MDRNIVYPGAIPLDTDILAINRNAMIGIGFLAQATLGTNAIVDGLACSPTNPPSLTVSIGPGSITQFCAVDTTSYGSIAADTSDSIVKMGINIGPTSFTLTAPTSVGQSINYIIEAAFLESDTDPIVLPYYNASNPAQTFSGPTNSGTTQNTIRTQAVQLQAKAGIPANTGSQVNPAADAGWIGLYQVVLAYGQTEIGSSSISVLPSAPFIGWKLPSLAPGFGSGVQSFLTGGVFNVPSGATQVEVEVWGGGAGTYASVAGLPSGGGSGGGYARRRVTGLAPGQAIAVTIGQGGAAGTTSGSPAGAGGTSSFGSFVSASGGSLNYLASISQPQNGATPSGVGIGGDVNFYGSAGQAGILNQGGMGGAAPFGGTQNSGTLGNTGMFPGGGASGAGTGANGTTPYDGAAGANGLAVVRW